MEMGSRELTAETHVHLPRDAAWPLICTAKRGERLGLARGERRRRRRRRAGPARLGAASPPRSALRAAGVVFSDVVS